MFQKIKDIIKKYKDIFIRLFAYASFFYLLFNNFNQLIFEIILCCFVIYLIEYAKKEVEKKKEITKKESEKLCLAK